MRRVFIGLVVSIFTRKGEKQNEVKLKVRRGGSKSITLG